MSVCKRPSGHELQPREDGSGSVCFHCDYYEDPPRPETFKQNGRALEVARFLSVRGSFRPSAIYCPDHHRMQWYTDGEAGEVVVCMVRDCDYFRIKYGPVYQTVGLAAHVDEESDPGEELSPECVK